jgi:hypothetical protein
MTESVFDFASINAILNRAPKPERAKVQVAHTSVYAISQRSSPSTVTPLALDNDALKDDA